MSAGWIDRYIFPARRLRAHLIHERRQKKVARMGFDERRITPWNTWAGILGEICMEEWLESAIPQIAEGGPHHTWILEGDFLTEPDFVVFGQTVDIKTTPRNAPMRMDYSQGIMREQKEKKKKVDWYFFAAYEQQRSPGMVRLLGAITREAFFENCDFAPKGTRIHHACTVHRDMWNLDVKHLMLPWEWLVYTAEAAQQ